MAMWKFCFVLPQASDDILPPFVALHMGNMLVLELHLHLQQLFANLLRVIIIRMTDILLMG